MITTEIYEDQSGDMAAVVLEDGEYSNYVPSPEMAAFEGDGFIEEARMGFPEAFPYEFDLAIGLTIEEAAAKAEQEYTLVAQIDDTVVLYPQRMCDYVSEFFQDELGEDVWREVLEQVSGDEGVEL